MQNEELHLHPLTDLKYLNRKIKRNKMQINRNKHGKPSITLNELPFSDQEWAKKKVHKFRQSGHKRDAQLQL